MTRRVMVNLVAGLSGAGKTTLVRQVLEHQVRGERVAVIVNEEGRTDRDDPPATEYPAADGPSPQVMRAEPTQHVVRLTNGCACCDGAQVMRDAVENVLDTDPPDRILIEAAGVAQPANILAGLFADERLVARVAIEPAIDVVDAAAFALQMDRQPFLCVSQIKACDVILLNKTDLVDPAAIGAMRSTIEQINPRAWIIECRRCDVPLPFLFMGQVEPSLREALETRGNLVDPRPDQLTCFSYVTPDATLSRERLERALHRMPADVFRVKGFVPTDEGVFLLNFVTGHYELEPVLTSGVLRLVFVGRDLRKERLVALIDRCRIVPSISSPGAVGSTESHVNGATSLPADGRAR